MKKVFILLLVICLCLVNLTSCLIEALDFIVFHLDKNGQYYLETNWDCDTETFVNKYHPLYLEEAQRLNLKYNLDLSLYVEYGGDGPDILYIFLYNGECTVRLVLNSKLYGFYTGYLYYYGNDGNFGQYEDFKPMVEFINDFTNYAAYDARGDQNHFERLYNEALKDENGYASWELHFDDYIGSVSYYVDLTYEAGYYYMAQMDLSCKKDCYRFEFEGLLKPIS